MNETQLAGILVWLCIMLLPMVAIAIYALRHPEEW